MDHTPYLQQLSQAEPWRLGKGQPRNALDPTWVPEQQAATCNGPVEWEPGTRWWVCQSCGYIGSAYTTLHYPAVHPIQTFFQGLGYYMGKRAESPQPLNLRTMLKQVLFIAGATLRYAAVQPLGNYTDTITREPG